MKSNYAYKVTGILAAVAAAAALSASAQDAAPEKPAVPPVAGEQTAPANAPATDPATQTTPDTTPNTSTTPDTGLTPQADVPPAAPDPAAGPVAEATPETTVLAPKDFMQQAFMANEFGIAAGQMALQQAKDSEVKDAAQAVVNDGLKVRADMIAAIQGSTADMHFDQNWSEDYKQKLAGLKDKTGDDFDTAYLATQGEITNSSTELYTSFASTGSDAAVKTFAANTLPTLQAENDKLEAASQGGQ